MTEESDSFDYNSFAFHFIASLRGGLPERCDFCDEAYGLTVHHITKHGHQQALPSTDVAEAMDWRDHLEYVLGFPAWITTRYPIPEEAGEWTCNECAARWRAEGVPGYGREAT